MKIELELTPKEFQALEDCFEDGKVGLCADPMCNRDFGIAAGNVFLKLRQALTEKQRKRVNSLKGWFE